MQADEHTSARRASISEDGCWWELLQHPGLTATPHPGGQDARHTLHGMQVMVGLSVGL